MPAGRGEEPPRPSAAEIGRAASKVDAFGADENLTMQQRSNTGLPSLFVVGFPKAGTTTLHSVLVRAGAVSASVKEPSVLLLDRHGLDEFADAYGGYYQEAATGPRIDASPYYIYDERAVDLMIELGTASHVLVAVRDPWKRVCSAYLDQFTQGFERSPLQRSLDDQLRRGPTIISRAERSASRDYLFGSCYGDYVTRLLSTPLYDRVRLVALERFDEPSTKDELRDWVGLPVPSDWGRDNTANRSTSAMPALVHGVAQQVGSMMPDSLHNRLAPLAKPAMAKLAEVPMPTGRKPRIDVHPETRTAAMEQMARANRVLDDLPRSQWIGGPPRWLTEQA